MVRGDDDSWFLRGLFVARALLPRLDGERAGGAVAEARGPDAE